MGVGVTIVSTLVFDYCFPNPRRDQDGWDTEINEIGIEKIFLNVLRRRTGPQVG